MNRRAFLGSIIGSTAALVLDPERLLWVPGAKTIFIPKHQSIAVVISEYSDFISMAYNKQALRQLQRNFVIEPTIPVLPAREGKTVQWYRYNL